MHEVFKTRYWFVICISLLLCTLSDSGARNPFIFGEALPKLRAIGLMEPQHVRFAMIDFKKKCYKVAEGDLFLSYKVRLIEKQSVTLEDLKNKKALQLKIS